MSSPKRFAVRSGSCPTTFGLLEPSPSRARLSAVAAGRTVTAAPDAGSGEIQSAARPMAGEEAAAAGDLVQVDHRRRRVRLMSLLAGVLAVLIVASVGISYQDPVLRRVNNGKVAIFRGLSQTVLGLSLNSVIQSTNIPVTGISAAAAQEVSRDETGTLNMARQFLANIRMQYETCQAAAATLHHWEVTKPPLIRLKVRRNGKIVTVVKPGKRAPKPIVPSYCPVSSTP